MVIPTERGDCVKVEQKRQLKRSYLFNGYRSRRSTKNFINKQSIMLRHLALFDRYVALDAIVEEDKFYYRVVNVLTVRSMTLSVE